MFYVKLSPKFLARSKVSQRIWSRTHSVFQNVGHGWGRENKPLSTPLKVKTGHPG